MKRLIIILTTGLVILSCSQKQDESNIKSLLLAQMEATYTNQNWFVPSKIALEGVTHEQAIWKDSTDNHSISEIVSHIIFWNGRVLTAFKGEKVDEFNDDNEETFIHENALDWSDAVLKLDSIQTEWEQAVEHTTDSKINEWGTEISNMASHTAYHTGQIIYIRKRNGWWK